MAQKKRSNHEAEALLNNSERSDQVPSGDLGGIDKEKALSLLKAKRPSPPGDLGGIDKAL